MNENVPLKFKNQQAAIRSASNIYTGSPIIPVREYVSNGVDAGAGVVQVVIDPAARRITIEDDGSGIELDKLRRIPQELGESEKKAGDIGEMALGILSFNGISGSMELVTRTPSMNGSAYVLGMEKGKEYAKIRNATMQEVMEKLGGALTGKGCRVLLYDVSKKALEALQPSRLARELSKAYDPLLRAGKMVMTVSTMVDGKQNERYVEQMKYPGPMIIEETLDLQDEAGRKRVFTNNHGEKYNGTFGIYIHLNPAGTNDTISVHHKGVRVCTLKGLLDDEVFCSGQLAGTIDENFLKQNSSKTGYCTDERMELFMEELKRYRPVIEQKVKDALDEIQSAEKNSLAKTLEDALGRAYDQLPGFVRSPGTGGHSGTGTGKPSGKKPKSPYAVAIRPFDIAESHQRFAVDLVYHHVILNEAHDDWQRFVNKGQDDREKRLYVVSQASKGCALLDFLKHYNREIKNQNPVWQVPQNIGFNDMQKIVERESEIFGVLSKIMGIVKKLSFTKRGNQK